MSPSPNAIAVLRFLFENANTANVLEAIEAAATDKYYAPETSLLRRTQPGELLCYATMRQIAEGTNLSISAARYQVRRLKTDGWLEIEQMSKLRKMAGGYDLISAQEAEFRNMSDEDVRPGANLYRLVKPQMPSLEEVALCKPAEQLTLPFPPNERTILALQARIPDPFSSPLQKTSK